ncbi:MAG: hypothetical protein AAFY38_08625 [Pseudomonadota bacterium]
MPLTHRSVPGFDLFHVVYSGAVDLRDVLRFFDVFEQDFVAHPNRNELCDAQALERVNLTRHELDDLLSLMVGIYRRNGCVKRIAFVTGGGPGALILDQVVTRFAAELPEVKAATFFAYDEALRHLALPPRFDLGRVPN